MKFFNKEIIKLGSADCHLHYTNNDSSSNHATLTLVRSGQAREVKTDDYYNNFLERHYVSGWRGYVHALAATIEKYNGLKGESVQ